MTSGVKFKRVLLKISGEVLMGTQQFGIDMQKVDALAAEIAELANTGAEVCLVIGGGNIFRGVSKAAGEMRRADADHIGMLATVMNALAMHNALERCGHAARVLSAIPMPTVCEPFARARAAHHLAKKRIVIFAAGTGNPFFTTDTTAALRAAEMECDVILKATSVDGVYTADPNKDPNAEYIPQISFADVLARNLKIMDAAAIALARDNDIPIIVFSIKETGNIAKVAGGSGHFTQIGGEYHG